MLTQLLCPLFSQGKMLPLSLMAGGITVELELGDFYDCFIQHADVQNQTWAIIRPELLVDTVSVDPSLSNSYATALLGGKSLPISMHNIFSFQSTIANANAVSIQIARGFSRLTCVYFSFTRQGERSNTFFYSPLEGHEPNTDNDTFRWSTQLGGDKQPVYDCRSISESFMRLRKAQYIADGMDSLGLMFPRYCTDTFIAAASFERAPGTGASHTGVNTIVQNLVLNLYNCGPHASTCHVVCHYDAVLNLSSGGAEFLY